MTSSGPIRIIAEAHVTPGRMSDLLPLLEPLVAGTRKEEGNTSYIVSHSTDDENHVIFIEEWASRDSFEAHLRAPHFETYDRASAPLLVAPARIIVAEALSI